MQLHILMFKRHVMNQEFRDLVGIYPQVFRIRFNQEFSYLIPKHIIFPELHLLMANWLGTKALLGIELYAFSSDYIFDAGVIWVAFMRESFIFLLSLLVLQIISSQV